MHFRLLKNKNFSNVTPEIEELTFLQKNVRTKISRKMQGKKSDSIGKYKRTAN